MTQDPANLPAQPVGELPQGGRAPGRWKAPVVGIAALAIAAGGASFVTHRIDKNWTDNTVAKLKADYQKNANETQARHDQEIADLTASYEPTIVGALNWGGREYQRATITQITRIQPINLKCDGTTNIGDIVAYKTIFSDALFKKNPDGSYKTETLLDCNGAPVKNYTISVSPGTEPRVITVPGKASTLSTIGKVQYQGEFVPAAPGTPGYAPAPTSGPTR